MRGMGRSSFVDLLDVLRHRGRCDATLSRHTVHAHALSQKFSSVHVIDDGVRKLEVLGNPLAEGTNQVSFAPLIFPVISPIAARLDQQILRRHHNGCHSAEGLPPIQAPA